GAGDAALHRAGGTAEDDSASIEADAATAAAAPHPGRQSAAARRAPRLSFVVQTFGVKTPFSLSRTRLDSPKCESQASAAGVVVRLPGARRGARWRAGVSDHQLSGVR